MQESERLADPISAYLGVGKMDSYRTTDVRAVLGPVVSLAAELKLAVIGIMHFNKKLDITNALLRISDSLAYGATARHVYGVIDDAENKRKLVVRAKNNLAANTAERTTLAFSFGVREVGTDPNNDKTIVAPYVIFEPEYVDVSAAEAMRAASENKSPGARDEAKKFLLAILANGPVAKTEIEEAAKAEGISERTLYRAKRELKNIMAKKDAVDGRGNIEAGDYQKFVYFLNLNHPFIDAVVLVSPGGVGEEALKIGHTIRQYFLNTFAPARWIPVGAPPEVDGYGRLFAPYQPPVGSSATLEEMLGTLGALTICEGPACHCASACFLIWAAGTGHYGSALGVHRPTIQSPEFANLPPDRASTLYRGLLAKIRSYLSDMEVPQKYIDMMSETASADIKWLTGEEAVAVGAAPSIVEWAAATCGPATKEDEQQILELLRRAQMQYQTGKLLPNGKLLSDEDQALQDALFDKEQRIGECEEAKKAQFRDAMPLPQTAAEPPVSVQSTAPPTCSDERFAAAQRFAQGSSLTYAFQALALCPVEFCPTVGQRIADVTRSADHHIQLLRFCPKFCSTIGRRLLGAHNPNWDVQVAKLCPNL